MVTLRGRAATPVRPGLVTKSVLLGETPLATGELVQEAAITDLHSAYKELVHRENTLRPRAKRLKPMTKFSFKTLFKFAQLLGLVELVREEPMQFPPPGGPLYSLRKTDGIHVVTSTRRVFKITPLGAEDEKSWTNLCKAWIEGWPAPQKAEYLPPVYKPRAPRAVKPPVVVPPVFAPYKWQELYSPKNLKAFAGYLETLMTVGVDIPGVPEELSRLAGKISGWIIEVDEAIDDARAIHYTQEVHRLEGILGGLSTVKEALLDHDLVDASSKLLELAG